MPAHLENPIIKPLLAATVVRTNEGDIKLWLELDGQEGEDTGGMKAGVQFDELKDVDDLIDLLTEARERFRIGQELGLEYLQEKFGVRDDDKELSYEDFLKEQDKND